MAILLLAVELLKWAALLGAFLVALYVLVRFVKWAWNNDPKPDPDLNRTSDGRPICQLCSDPIPPGQETRLTNEEKNAISASIPGGFKVGDFRHKSEADCVV